MPFACSICGEESTRICARCTKDSCSNHLCEKCARCSDCCECEIRLTEPEHAQPRLVYKTVKPDLEDEFDNLEDQDELEDDLVEGAEAVPEAAEPARDEAKPARQADEPAPLPE